MHHHARPIFARDGEPDAASLYDDLASPYASCQFHHAYGGVWG
jgi:hypothetical protein